MNGLRILGVRILKGCPPHIKKALHADTLYLLYNDYKENGKNIYNLRKKSVQSQVASTLYNVNNIHGRDIHINISAIVGKNGDGKSSIIEVAIRILNNFACQTGFRVNHDSLAIVENVNAILYYELNNHVFAIASEGENSSIELYEDGKPILEIDPTLLNDNQSKKVLKQKHLDKLFYTIIVNYSIYAYNSSLLKNENEGTVCWIDSLFHKNDSYQTPIVINPMRTNGNIDINNEEYLSRQRLLSLYASSDDGDQIRKINDDQQAIGYAFNLERESKLIKNSIRRYFNENSDVRYTWLTVDEIRDDKASEMGIQELNTAEFLIDSLANFSQLVTDLFNDNSELLRIVEDFFEKKEVSKESDLVFYLARIRKFADSGIGKNKDVRSQLGLIDDFLESTSAKKGFNYTQFYRIIVIVEIWKYLQSSRMGSLFHNSLNEALIHYNEPKHAAQLYVVYKILSILSTYHPFIDHPHIYDSSFDLLINPLERNTNLSQLKEDVEKVLELNDYTSLKLHQALNYLKYLEEGGGDEYLHADSIEKERSDYKYALSFQQIKDIVKQAKGNDEITNFIQYLPPPIFIGNIIFCNNGGDKFDYTSLSSGELQLLNTVGALIYHLRNLDDNPLDDDLIQYKDINVIFEEVELYFHPEYQRRFISYLLNMIERSDLKNIESLNICFVTHSPFILSDVLRNNTLYLRNGEPGNKEIPETFGANIYDMLANSFFLDENAMGEFASQRIQRIIDKFNEGKEIARNELSIIGDSLIKDYVSGTPIKVNL